jgi:hypothetical protein
VTVGTLSVTPPPSGGRRCCRRCHPAEVERVADRLVDKVAVVRRSPFCGTSCCLFVALTARARLVCADVGLVDRPAHKRRPVPVRALAGEPAGGGPSGAWCARCASSWRVLGWRVGGCVDGQAVRCLGWRPVRCVGGGPSGAWCARCASSWRVRWWRAVRRLGWRAVGCLVRALCVQLAGALEDRQTRGRAGDGWVAGGGAHGVVARACRVVVGWARACRGRCGVG